MGIKCGRLRRMNGYRSSGFLVRHVDCTRSIFPYDARVPAHQPPGLFFFRLFLSPPLISAMTTSDDGDGETEGSYKSSRSRRVLHLQADNVEVVGVEGDERVTWRMESGLGCHNGQLKQELAINTHHVLECQRKGV